MARLRLETSVSYDHPRKAEKPLPPTPRKPSSSYTMSTASPPGQDNSYDGRIVDEYLLKESMYLLPKTYSSSTSNLPDPVPPRPKLQQLAKSHVVSDIALGRRTADRNKSRERDMSPGVQNKSRKQTESHKTTEKLDAQWHANDYSSVLHVRSSVWHSATPDQYFPTYGSNQPPMSPRITDVVDQSLVPSPLSSNIIEKGPEPESRFSSDSSDAGGRHNSLRDSLKRTARKAFHSRKNSSDSQHKGPPPKPKTRVSSESSGQRVSLQAGIEDMYDTLTGFYSSPSKNKPGTSKPSTPKPTTPLPAKPQPEPTRNVRRPNQHRTPAVPITPYQRLGPKAWEQENQSSKGSKVRFLAPFGGKDKESKSEPTTAVSGIRRSNSVQSKSRTKPSLTDRLVSKFHNGSEKIEQAIGLETDKVKRTRSQKKREALKRKIVVVGLGDREQAGGGRWI